MLGLGLDSDVDCLKLRAVSGQDASPRSVYLGIRARRRQLLLRSGSALRLLRYRLLFNAFCLLYVAPNDSSRPVVDA